MARLGEGLRVGVHVARLGQRDREFSAEIRATRRVRRVVAGLLVARRQQLAAGLFAQRHHRRRCRQFHRAGAGIHLGDQRGRRRLAPTWPLLEQILQRRGPVVHARVAIAGIDVESNRALARGRHPPTQHRAVFGVERAGQIRDALQRGYREREPAQLDQACAVQLVTERRAEIRSGADPRRAGATLFERAVDRFGDAQGELATLTRAGRTQRDREEAIVVGAAQQLAQHLGSDEAHLAGSETIDFRGDRCKTHGRKVKDPAPIGPVFGDRRCPSFRARLSSIGRRAERCRSGSAAELDVRSELRRMLDNFVISSAEGIDNQAPVHTMKPGSLCRAREAVLTNPLQAF